MVQEGISDMVRLDNGATGVFGFHVWRTCPSLGYGQRCILIAGNLGLI
jgi:hypothetical protein